MSQSTRMVIGWREWVGLPELGIALIKAKVDTGARTSSLHASDIICFERDGESWVRFCVQPHRTGRKLNVECEARVADFREVSDSGGHREKRFVVVSRLQIGAVTFPIEITLHNRETMSHRMLIGRSAMRHLIIDPAQAFLLGKPTRKAVRKKTRKRRK